MPRATPLPAEERRAALLAATEPLLQRCGRAISTRQIAESAGVAEGTIFRVFPTKEALIDACLEEAFDIGPTCEALGRLAVGTGLEATVTAAVTQLQGHLRRVIALFHTVRFDPTSPEQVDDLKARQHRDNAALTAALAEVLRPFAGRLRRPPVEAAALLQMVTFSLTHPMLGEGRVSTPEEITDLVLHGLAQPTEAPC